MTFEFVFLLLVVFLTGFDCKIDRCDDKVINAKGCYAGVGCHHFFVCANSVSYAMCCPHGTSFADATCTCVTDANCTDQCVQEPSFETITSSLAPPHNVNASVCIDSYGSKLAVAKNEPDAYYLLDDDHGSFKMFCPGTTLFNLTTCGCTTLTSTTLRPKKRGERMAIFWAPFDDDTKDHSTNKFITFLEEGADRDDTDSALGAASLRLAKNGYLSIPGLSYYDFQSAASFCAYFECEGDACFSSSIFSNYKATDEFSVVIGTQRTNVSLVKLNFREPAIGIKTLSSRFDVPLDGWNHICMTYDSKAIRVYINGELAETQLVTGLLSYVKVPYLIGYDPELGNFNGHIDEVLITPFSMTREEIQAHQNSDLEFLNARGFGLDVPPESPRPKGPDGLFHFEDPSMASSTGKQFFVTRDATTWQQAKTLCEENGGQLAVVENKQENKRSATLLASVLPRKLVWVDLTEQVGERKRFQWRNGEEAVNIVRDSGVSEGGASSRCGSITISKDPEIGFTNVITPLSCDRTLQSLCERPIAN